MQALQAFEGRLRESRDFQCRKRIRGSSRHGIARGRCVRIRRAQRRKNSVAHFAGVTLEMRRSHLGIGFPWKTR